MHVEARVKTATSRELGTRIDALVAVVSKIMPSESIKLKSIKKRKQWQLEKGNRFQQLDKMANEIMANEAIKIITRAYEEVSEGKECQHNGRKIRT